MKRSTGYNVLKGAANKATPKRPPGTVSPIRKLAVQPVAVPVKPTTHESSDRAIDKGQEL
jgi:hypothetical protein